MFCYVLLCYVWYVCNVMYGMCGMVSYGMAWYGMVWYGMAWYVYKSLLVYKPNNYIVTVHPA